MFCLNDAVTGYLHSFELYGGRGDVPRAGLAKGVVLRLLELSAAIGVHRILFVDSYYGGVPLALLLATSYQVLMVAAVKSRNSLPGTVRQRESFPFNVPQGSAKDRVERGWLRRAVLTVQHGRHKLRVAAYLWKDNKFVTMISTAWTGVRGVADTVRRSVAKGFDKVNLTAFAAVVQYQHEGMNGTDRLDRLVADKSCSFRTRKWTSRVFFWLVDVVCANMWIICHMIPRFQSLTTKKGHMGARFSFQYQLGAAIMHHGVAAAKDRAQRKQATPAAAAASDDYFDHDNTHFLPEKRGPRPPHPSQHDADHDLVHVRSDRCQVCEKMWGTATRTDRTSVAFKEDVANTNMCCNACGIRICHACHGERVWDHTLAELREGARSKYASWKAYLHAHPRRPHQGRA